MQVDRQRYLELINSFLDLAVKSDDSLVDSAVAVFIPKGGAFTDANIVTWVPASDVIDVPISIEKSFMAMSLAMIGLGADKEKMKASIDLCHGSVYDMGLDVSEQDTN